MIYILLIVIIILLGIIVYRSRTPEDKLHKSIKGYLKELYKPIKEDNKDKK